MKKLDINKIKYIVYSVFGVLIIVFLVYHVIKLNSQPYKTEIALEREVQNTVSVKAFAVRDESFITAENNSGTVVSVAEDGKRVARGDTVAVVFKNSESAAAYVRINEIKSEINFYNQLKNRVGVGTNAPSSYNSLIDNACIDYIKASHNEINSSFNEALNDLRDAVTARQLAVGQQLSVDAKVSGLQAELASLQTQSIGYTDVLSPNPGYYIGAVDGFENAVSYEDVLNLNVEKISSLLASQKQAVSENVMGKLVDGFNWYLLCNVPYDSSVGIEVGKAISVDLPNTPVGKIKCTVAFKGNNENGFVAVVLRCNMMNRNVANLRIEDIDIITDEYVGIQINNKAIREVEGEKGVYIKNGNVVRFKKINILYSTEEYSVVKKKDDSAFVRQYDTIIVEGVDLRDGKIVS